MDDFIVCGQGGSGNVGAYGGIMKIDLSVLVVVHNEEKQLSECLELLGFADEVVVVLDNCTDGSKAIA